MMDEAELLRDYIDVLIWPVAIFVIVALATNRFRVQIEALINRIQLFRGPGGTEVHAPLPEQKPEGVEQPADHPPEAAAVKSSSDKEVELPLPTEYLDSIKESGEAETQAAELMREALANTQWALYYERVYRVLWGTQISLLQALNERLDGVTRAEVMVTYLERHNKAVQQFNPSYKNDLMTYMTFLSGQGLVQFKEPSSYVITELGNDFLTYMARLGISPAKWY